MCVVFFGTVFTSTPLIGIKEGGGRQHFAAAAAAASGPFLVSSYIQPR